MSCGWTPRVVVSLVFVTLSAGFAVLWWFFGETTAAAAATVAAAVLAAAPVVDSLRAPRDRPSPSRVVAELADQLAERVEEQWEAEAVHRQLRDPQPIAVRWSEAAADVMDHPDLILPNARRLWLADSIDHVVDAYRALPRRRLVVLGGPGSGKSGVLLLLTLGLLRERRPGQPVPVLLSLASWEPRRQPFLDWLRRHLADEYRFLRRSGARALLTRNAIVPLLDGLDELPDPARASALTAINRAWAQRPLVVGCRSGEYAAAVHDGDVLTGTAVVELAPVPRDDVREYLRRSTPPDDRLERWAPIFSALRSSAASPIADALSTPLMMSLARSIYALDRKADPASLADAARFPTSEAIEASLLDALVPAALVAREESLDDDVPRWAAEKVERWLRFVATTMAERRTYDLAWWEIAPLDGPGRLFGRLVFGLQAGLLIGLTGGLRFGLAGWLLGAVGGTLVYGHEFGRTVRRDGDRRPGQFLARFDRAQGIRLVIGLLVGWAVGFAFVLAIEVGRGFVPGTGGGFVLWHGLLGGALGAAVAAVAFGLVGGSNRRPAPDVSLRGDQAAAVLTAVVWMVAGGFVGATVFQLGLVGSLVFALEGGLLLAGRHAWAWYQVSRAWAVLRRRLPLRTMAFLREAYRLGILRQAGAVYQFRHARLQDRLAGDAAPRRR